MTDWRAAYARRDWNAIENWWRFCEDMGELRALLQALQRDVPRVQITNGVEVREDFIHPKDAPEEWRGAAKILQFGELEAMIEGDPPSELEEWREKSEQVTVAMRDFLEAGEETTGHASLSRAAHARDALAQLETVARDTRLMCASIDPDGDKPEDRAWLEAVIAQAALAAFFAGIHARAALGKSFEAHAVRGKKTKDSARLGGNMRAAKFKQHRANLIAAMQALIDNGYGKSAAARSVYKSGLGTSADGNRKTYQRHHR